MVDRNNFTYLPSYLVTYLLICPSVCSVRLCAGEHKGWQGRQLRHLHWKVWLQAHICCNWSPLRDVCTRSLLSSVTRLHGVRPLFQRSAHQQPILSLGCVEIVVTFLMFYFMFVIHQMLQMWFFAIGEARLFSLSISLAVTRLLCNTPVAWCSRQLIGPADWVFVTLGPLRCD